MVFQMSNDVSGTSTPVETVQNDSVAQSQAAPQSDSQFQSNTTPARVPVEVVVHGVEDSIDASGSPEPTVTVNATSEVVDSEADESVEKTSASKEAVAKEAPDEVVTEKESPAKKIVAKKIVAKEVSTEEVSTGETSSESVEVPVTNAFQEMGLSPGVMEAIETAGYQTPSPIQAETVPCILEGRDLMGQAETGSGKTAAFAWPLLSKIDMKQSKPQVLVLAPTRELAIQVTAAFEKYARGIKGFRAVTIYGGQSYETQLRALNRGVQVVVGTPGRVMDHLRRKTLDLRALKTLVLDEADEMLRMGFIDDVEWILEQVPEKRQVLSFSATLPPPIQRIAEKYLENPANVSIKTNSATADSIDQTCVFLHAREKMARLVRILETEETDGVIVFVKTRSSTLMVAENLIQKGIIASPLNGDIPQNQRERTVNQLKSGRINVVVATDVAARGLDVKRISHVVNYDFPHDTEAYVHRIGRTGRAGRTGCAILFVEPKEKGKLGRLQRATNQKIEQLKQRSIDEINQQRVEKFKQRIVAATEDQQIKYFTKLVSDFQNDSELPFETIAGALAVLAQGDSPLLLKELSAGKSNWRKDGDGSRGSKGRRAHGTMVTYRVEVGRNHGVGPGNIVGAVTNEANLNNADIGRINIFDSFSTIDLPSDMPQDLIDHLRNVHVSGQRLAISKSDRSYAKPGGRKSSPTHGGGRYDRNKSYGNKKSFGGKKFGGKKYGDKSYGDKQGSARGSNAHADKNSSEKKPFERRPTENKFGDKKPAKKSTKGKSNASVQRTELGEKRDRYAREGDRYAAKPKSFKSTPKTKAAARTKAKRKPGAKPSSPMKKYVKIRSAK